MRVNVIGPADGTAVGALLDTGRRTERNHCCCIRVGEKPLLLDKRRREPLLLLLDARWRETMATTAGRRPAGRRETITTGRWGMARKICVLLDTERQETAAVTRYGEKPLLLLDAGR